MIVYCGDCGTETVLEGRFRVCRTCGTRTMLAGRAVGKSITGRLTKPEPAMQNIPIRTPEGRRIRDAFPRPPLDLDYRELELRFTGGGVQGACHECGNAHGECEC